VAPFRIRHGAIPFVFRLARLPLEPQTARH
jgi:hypothetical protein